MGFRHRGTATGLAIPTVLATCLLAGCATRMSEQEVDTQLRRAIAEVPARRAIRRVVPIYAQTKMEAWLERTDSESSPLSLELAEGFLLGRVRKIDYFIGGPYPELSEQHILDGLRLNESALPGLRIVLVSPAPPTPGLLSAAKAKRVRLEYRALH